ncbi:hypothetical protein POM88_044826 [Heracleum sosnowskyi]|uniref:Reverse transcriptase zinc-binding domain-containing protein n=1 Tax=Heracleum sosnowskyi TaxID=360622 RepID=A0AAD8H3H9_9APIA|nr:hypothetical protein POM88_044826 [Heracleum sosnowskyi]
MESFNDFIKDQNLFDIDLSNTKFTWIGSAGKKSRLDRVLVCEKWFAAGEWGLFAMHRKKSDHKRLIFKHRPCNWGPKPMKIFNCWLNEDSLQHLLKAFWCQNADLKSNVQVTIKEVKKIIKGWAFNLKDRTETSIKELEEILDKDDQVSETNKELIQKRKQLEHLYDLRDDMLRQKSRLNWQKNGDRNSKFFHQVIQKRRKRNAINNLVWCNKRISNPNALKEAFYQHFKDFFEEKESLSLFKLGNLVDRLISEREQEWLEREISMEDIEFALSLSANEKAPGPDGFNMGCIRFLWQHLKSAKGGLGLSSVHKRNVALLGKWHWKWLMDREKGWNIWVRAKYRVSKGDSISHVLKSSNHSECFSSIVEVNNMPSLNGWLDAINFKWKIGDGEQILFLEDYWCSQGTLKLLFPRLYKISKLKCVNFRVYKDLLDCYEAYGEVFWIRYLRIWEQEQVDAILEICSKISLKRNRDSLIRLPVEGNYTAASSYELLASDRSETKVAWNFIWKYKVPPKVQIFLWNYFNKILPTSSFLANRLGQSFLGSRACKWCNRDEESQMHLFWKCEMAKWAWSFVSSWWNIEVKIGDARNISLKFKGPSTRVAWEITWSATM